MKYRFYLVLIFLAGSAALADSDWQRVEGRYSIVEYLPQHRAIADSILRMADDVIPDLCAWHGVELKRLEKKKAHIIFTDAPDITNGFAVGETIVIYATSSGLIPGWTGKDNWYRTVVTHELAHHVTFRALQRKLSFLGIAHNLTTPRWFYEGIAQYMAEDWTLTRGDFTLQSSLLNGNLTYNSLKNLTDGRLLYASANAYIRWLAQTYGDSSLIKLMAHNKDGFFYDFDEAFKDTYDDSPAGLFPEFTRQLILHYGDKLASYPEVEWAQLIPKYGSNLYQLLPFSASDSSYILLVREKSEQLYLSALKARLSGGNWRNTEHLVRALSTPVILSPDKRFIAYGRVENSVKNNLETLRWRWYRMELESGDEHLLSNNLRARYGVFDAQNRLIIVNVDGEKSSLIRLGDSAIQDTLLSVNYALGRIDPMPGGGYLLEGQRGDGSRALFRWMEGDDALTVFIEDGKDNRNPAFTPSGELFLNSYEEQMPVIRQRLADGSIKTLLKSNRPYFIQAATDTSLIVSTLVKGNARLAHLPLDSLRGKPQLPQENWTGNRYSAWTTHEPPQVQHDIENANTPQNDPRPIAFPQGHLLHGFSFALPDYDPDLGYGISGVTSWFEPLQRQALVALFGIYPESMDESVVFAGHYLRALEQEWSTWYYRGPVFFSFDGDDYETLYSDILSFGLIHQRYWAGQAAAPWYANLDYTYYRYRAHDFVPDFDFHGPRLTLGSSWRLPSRYDPFLPERMVEGSVNIFRSLQSDYAFTQYGAQLSAGSTLLMSELGLRGVLSYTRLQGDLPPFIGTGIDRFYEFDVPRDLRFTRTLRGVREDIYGDEMTFATLELNYLLTERSGLVLLVMPINNVMLSGFAEGARVSAQRQTDIYSVGGELSFGDANVRFSGGYASSKVETLERDERIYVRFKLYLPGF